MFSIVEFETHIRVGFEDSKDLLLKILELLNSGTEEFEDSRLEFKDHCYQSSLFQYLRLTSMIIATDLLLFWYFALTSEIFNNLRTIITKLKDLKSTELPPNFGPPL